MQDRALKMEKIFHRMVMSKQVKEAVLLVENAKGDFTYTNGYGGKDKDSLMIMASVTKLFTTTCILKLIEQHKISMDDLITNYVEPSTLQGLHCYKGREYSYELTIHDLIYQTSGLPDVFEETSHSVKKQMISEDLSVDLHGTIRMTKQLKPHFPPNSCKKAWYADINFDLLGEIIEKVTDLPIDQVYKRFIFEPLGLKNTYLPVSENDKIPNIYYKDKSFYRPKSVICSKASGGCVSTATDLMIFLKAFFGGRLFKEKLIEPCSTYKKLQSYMGPVSYGCGHMQIPLGRIGMLFQGKGELYGHTGSTGSFAYYYPLKDLFLVGDMNQMANPALPVRLVIQLAIND